MRMLAIVTLVVAGCLGTPVWAQDAGGTVTGERGARAARPNWDPEQMQQRMFEMYKQQLGSNDDDWQALRPLLLTVLEKQQAIRQLQNRVPGGGVGMGGHGRGATAAPAAPAAPAVLPEVQAVIDANSSADNAAITKALSALRAARVQRRAELLQAQAALQEVLTLQQETVLVLSGLLD